MTSEKLIQELVRLPLGFDVLIESSGDEYPPRHVGSIHVDQGRIVISSQEAQDYTSFDPREVRP